MAKMPILSHPIEYQVLKYVTRGQEEPGTGADRTLRGHQRDMDPTNRVTVSIKKLTHKPLGPSHLRIFQNGTQAHPKLCAPYPLPHGPHHLASTFCALLLVAPASFGRGPVSMLKIPVVSEVQGETTNLSFGFSIGEAKGGCGHMAWCVAKSRESIQA